MPKLILFVLIIVLLLQLFSTTCSQQCPKRYDNYKIYRVELLNQQDVKVLNEIRDEFYIDLTRTQYVVGDVDVIIGPEDENQILRRLNAARIRHTKLIANVQARIKAENPKNAAKKEKYMNWKMYHCYDTIYNWVKTLPSKNSQVSVDVYGQTVEERDLFVIKVIPPGAKRKVFIEAGANSNEWISIATATYLLSEIVNGTNAELSSIASQYAIYIAPIANPDGYNYSTSCDRLWTKNRNPLANSKCLGVNVNRNWDYHWDQQGASNKTCALDYAGPSGFSENESSKLQAYVTNNIPDNLLAYIALHSYGQQIMYPYCYSKEYPDNVREHIQIAKATAKSMKKRYKKDYAIGNCYNLTGPMSGTSIDWAISQKSTTFSFTFNLRDISKYTYFIPFNQIESSGKELVDGLTTMLNELLKYA